MKMRIPIFILSASICSLLAGTEAENPPISPADLDRIDAHAHLFNTSPAIYRMLDRLNLRIVNICVVDKYDPGFEEAEPQHETARQVFSGTNGRAAWCSTFDPQDWESPGFAARAIASLDKTFEDGAIAVKIYKSIGMELKSKSGEYLMPDNAVFDPIYEALIARDKTLYAHLAEPSAAWRPLDPSSPHYSYYKENPDWHMYLHPERPAKEAILAARDRILARHPKLRMVGCHLGSMEENVDDIAERFDRYPNFAVDTAARVPDLMLQPREKVRAFLIKYQDRVLYATDLVAMPGEDGEKAVKRWEDEYARDWKYFATDETVEYSGHKIRGLALPEEVLRKFYHSNALHWVPGILGPK